MASRALLVGINKYRIPGSDLRGCVNDVRNIAAALERRGFKKADIATLVDERATKKAMQDGIRQLIRGGRKGDVLLIHRKGRFDEPVFAPLA
jgi:metacaspase-1